MPDLAWIRAGRDTCCRITFLWTDSWLVVSLVSTQKSFKLQHRVGLLRGFSGPLIVPSPTRLGQRFSDVSTFRKTSNSMRASLFQVLTKKTGGSKIVQSLMKLHGGNVCTANRNPSGANLSDLADLLLLWVTKYAAWLSLDTAFKRKKDSTC